jgi:uncharacterized protein (DUF4415 family)
MTDIVKKNKIMSYQSSDFKNLKDNTDYERLDNMKDEDIDYSDIPETNEALWANAKVVDYGNKKLISLRIDRDTLAWFKNQGGRYQRLMNDVLKRYMQVHK